MGHWRPPWSPTVTQTIGFLSRQQEEDREETKVSVHGRFVQMVLFTTVLFLTLSLVHCRFVQMVLSTTVLFLTLSLVHRRVVQMVLFTTVLLWHTFYSLCSIVPKAILDIIEKWIDSFYSLRFTKGAHLSVHGRFVQMVLFTTVLLWHTFLSPLSIVLEVILDIIGQWIGSFYSLCSTKRAHLRLAEVRLHNSKVCVLAAPQSLTPSDGSSSSTGTPAPKLYVDSGAFHHVVGDAGILTDLRDAPAGTVVTVADGFQLPVTKVGVIQAPHIKISDVYLVPGLEMNLVSVRQLAKSKIFTTFYENHAELWLEGEQIGGAIVDNDVSLYRLLFFMPHA